MSFNLERALDDLAEAGAARRTADDEADLYARLLSQLADNGAIEIPGSNLSLSAPGFLAMLYTNNGTLYSDDLKSVTWNSQEGIDTLTWMFEYVQRHFGGHQNWMDWSNAIQPGERRFDQGRLAMEFQNVSASLMEPVPTGSSIPCEASLVSMSDAANHIDHICQIAGNTRHAGIGSDTSVPGRSCSRWD